MKEVVVVEFRGISRPLPGETEKAMIHHSIDLVSEPRCEHEAF
jgi:hypothetical protein